MAAPTQDDFNNLLTGIKDLTKTVGSSNNDSKAANRSAIGLTAQLGSLYKIQEAVSRASQLQINALRYNAETTRAFSTTLTSAPGFTNLNTSMALLEAGLEDNSQNLGEFFARASLLGENIEQMAFGLRNLRGTLALNNNETAIMANSIEDAAKTYGTSSERLVDSLNKFGNTLAILNRTSTGQNQAIVDLIAATERQAPPGALQSLLGSLLGGGAQSIARLGVLGAQAEGGALMRGEGGLAAGRGLLDKLVSLRDQVVGTGENAILGSQIFEQLTGGITLEQANMAETLRDILDQQKNNPRLNAILDDAFGSLNAIMEELKGPLAHLTVSIVEGLGGIKNIMQSDIVKYLVKAAGITGILIAMSASLRLLTLITSKSSALWLGIFTAISFLIPALDEVIANTLGIAEDTKTTADIAKNQQENRTLSLLEEYNKRHAATLNTLIREDNKMNLEPLLTEKEALTQSVKQTQLFEIMVKMIGDQNDMLGKKTSAFTPNPAGIK